MNARKRARYQENGTETPAKALAGEGTIYYDSSKDIWIAELPWRINNKRVKFYSRQREEAIRKRKEYLRNEGLLRILNDFVKLCNQYGLTVTEFLDYIAPTVRQFAGEEK